MIDVYNGNGVIDWAAVFDSGVRRAYIKLGEDGMSLGINRQPPIPDLDPYAVLNLHHARAVGMQVGLYWFARPGSHTPAQSAQRCLSLAHGHWLPGDLPIALDLEVSGGLSIRQLDWWKGSWFVPVDKAIGCRGVFYSFRYWLNAFTFYNDRPIWGAHPGTLTQAERDRWSFWQYGQGHVPGITGFVDFDEVLHPEHDGALIPVIPPPPAV